MCLTCLTFGFTSVEANINFLMKPLALTQTGENTCWSESTLSVNLWRLTAVAEVTGVVLGLVVDPHVISDVGSREQLPTDVTRNLFLMADQMSTQAIPRGKRWRARLQERWRHTEGRESPLTTWHLWKTIKNIRPDKKTTLLITTEELKCILTGAPLTKVWS